MDGLERLNYDHVDEMKTPFGAGTMIVSSTKLEPEVIEGNESIEYRSISGLSVGALILGILSSLALVHIVLWVIPVLALILGGVALRHARRTESGGEWVAGSAICLALFFGIWGVSQLFFADWILMAKARKVGDAWMKLIENGKLKQAHQWTLTPSSRVLDLTLLELYYEGNNDGTKSYVKFLEKGEMVTLSSLPTGTTIQFRSFDEWLKNGNQDLARIRYTVHMPDSEREVVIAILREREQESHNIQWRIMAVESPGEAGTEGTT